MSQFVTPKNILVVGSSGYVGSLVTEYLSSKYKVYGLNSTGLPDGTLACDLRERNSVLELAKKNYPDVIIHLAGNKDIKFCEKNPREAYASNASTAANLVEAFPAKKIIYISSDYVFDGSKGNYTEDDKPDPRTVYGKSKLAGEEYGLKNSDNFVVLRSSAIFNEKAAFLTFLNQELSSGRKVECFTNTFYAPAYYSDFLEVLERLVANDGLENRIYHSCGERVSRYDFAAAYAKVFGFDATLIKKSVSGSSHWFLFSDLSLLNQKTNRILGTKTTGLEAALLVLKNK